MITKRNAWLPFTAFVITGALAMVFAATPVALAACSGTACISEAVTQANPGNPTDLPSVLKTIVNLLLFVIGAVSVIMIVVGGLKYTLSNGESSQVTSAKNTILYAVVGVVVALLAFAIVNFVLVQFI